MSEEIVDLTNEKTSDEQLLAIIDDKKLSQQEQFVFNALKDYEYHKTVRTVDPETGIVTEATEMISGNPVEMIRQIFDEANEIVTQNAKGDIIPDFKARAQIKMKLLEGMGVMKKKQVEVKVNFLSLLFGKKD